MLSIQKFIRENPDNWERLLAAAPYHLKIVEWKDQGLFGFHYRMGISDFSEEIVQEARGLILDKNADVVAYPFKKFFNSEEPLAAEIDWNSAFSTFKIDGSLIIVFYYHGWQVATSSGRNASEAPLGNSFTFHNFRELFGAAATNSNFDFDRLDPRYTYCFELVSKYNKVVINYDMPELYHIFSRNNLTLEEELIDIGVRKPKRFDFNSKRDYQELIRRMEDDDSVEGIVVQDKYFNRVKMKTQSYVRRHYLRQNDCWSKRTMIEAILRGETGEVLSYYPEYKGAFAEIKMNMAILSLKYIFLRYVMDRKKRTKKELAIAIADKDKIVQSLFFKAYDNVSWDELKSKWTAKNWMNYLEIVEDEKKWSMLSGESWMIST